MTLPINAILALAAAAFWGGGDFSGGIGVKAAGGSTSGALRVVLTAHAASLIGLLVWLALQPVSLPRGAGAAAGWAIAAGAAGALSVTAFYLALSRGAMGASAAISGLLAAATPAVVSSVLEGTPAAHRLIGFVIAAAAIWMIAAAPSPENIPEADTRAARITTALAIFGGLGFGFYFVALRECNPLGVVLPMAIARATSVLLCAPLLLLILQTEPHALRTEPHAPAPSRRWLPWQAVAAALGVAVLDTGGNMFFVAATRAGRLDVAAVLASLYPAGTILLAAWQLHERATPRQRNGMLLALAAVVLVTL
jgi:drug/metabolite transporter (DMT)-like permease